MILKSSLVVFLFAVNRCICEEDWILKSPINLRGIPMESTRRPRVFTHPTVYRCGDHGRDLVVNFVNINYPDNDTRGTICKFRLIITNPQICQVRVDFVDTEMHLPERGECNSQRFEVEGSIWPTGLPPLCGKQNDQHFYLHLEPWVSNATFVDFKLNSFGSSGDGYRFGVWLTQIDCSSFNVLKAPLGCSQYFLGETGVVKSFNFDGSQYLSGQNYRICIRPSPGNCGIRYEAKTGEFGIRKSILTGMNGRNLQISSGTGAAQCAMDYIVISDGQRSINTNENQNVMAGRSRKERLFFKRRKGAAAAAAAPAATRLPIFTTTYDRYCGGRLSPTTGQNTNQPIYAKIRSNIISLDVKSSGSKISKMYRQTGDNSTLLGFRLSYQQLRDCVDGGKNETSDMVSKPKWSGLLQTLANFQYHGRPSTNPIGSSIFRDELVSESITSTTGDSIHVLPTTPRHISNNTLIHRLGNLTNSTLIGSSNSESERFWDYLEDTWAGGHTEQEYDF